MQVVAHHDFEALAKDWDALAMQSALRESIFLTLGWQRAWWRHLGRGELWLLAAHAEDGALRGIVPLSLYEGRLALLGCIEVGDYLDMIGAPQHAEAVWGAALDFLCGPSAPSWEVLYLCSIHDASPTRAVLLRLAQARGLRLEVQEQDACPVVPLPATWEEYLARLDGKQRHEIRRRLRQANANPDIGWTIADPSQNLMAEVEDFIALMRASHPDKDAFMTDAMQAFFREVAHEAAARGALQLAFLTVRGQKAATLFNFDWQNRVLVYNSGFDPRRFPDLGAGFLLTVYTIQHAIAQGREAYDFMRGREAYKYRFGGQDVSVWDYWIRRPE